MESINKLDKSKRRIAIYIRVSTVEQKIDGYSLGEQERRLIDYVSNNSNMSTNKECIYTDAHTGSDLNRNGLNQLMADVKQKKYDAVLVWKIDRLSRNLKHLLNIFDILKDNGASFISVQENIDFTGPIGNLIFQIFGAIAQFERELIKGRTRMGIIGSAEMGNYTGHNIPYGYQPIVNPSGKGKKLKIIEKEREWIQQIYDWCIYEDLGSGQIANKLNELGVVKGKHTRLAKDKHTKWTPKSVDTIFTNEIYCGKYVANKKDDNGEDLKVDDWTIVSIPACVSELAFKQAQIARENRLGGTRHTDYLLSGKLIDMTLDKSKKFSGAKRSKGGFSYRRPQFIKDGIRIPVFEIPGKQMEDFIWEKVLKALNEPEAFIKHYLSEGANNPSNVNKIESHISSLKESIANEDLTISKVESAYENGSYSEEKMNEKVRQKNEKITTWEGKVNELYARLELISSLDVEIVKLKEASKQVKYKLSNLDRKQKKVLCNLFVDRIEMFREEIGKTKGGKSKWNIKAEVYFRFNPQLFSKAIDIGRTQKGLKQGEYTSLSKKGDSNGAQERT